VKKTYYVCLSDLESAVAFVSVADMMRLVEATNNGFSMWRDKKQSRIVVECDNAPQDAPASGVFWKGEN